MIQNNWWELYRAAVLEIDRNKLRDRVEARKMQFGPVRHLVD